MCGCEAHRALVDCTCKCDHYRDRLSQWRQLAQNLEAELEEERDRHNRENERADFLLGEVEELRLDLQEMTHNAQTNFTCAIRDSQILRQVRTYARARCTEEFGDYASASVVLGILDGEINIEEENEPL